jgi:hypothetical protein
MIEIFASVQLHQFVTSRLGPPQLPDVGDAAPREGTERQHAPGLASPPPALSGKSRAWAHQRLALLELKDHGSTVDDSGDSFLLGFGGLQIVLDLEGLAAV